MCVSTWIMCDHTHVCMCVHVSASKTVLWSHFVSTFVWVSGISQLSDLHFQSLDSLGKCFYPLSHLSKCWLFLIWLRLLTKLNFAIGRCVLEKTVFIVFTTDRAVRHPGVGSRNALASLLDQSSGFRRWIESQPAGAVGFLRMGLSSH